MRTAQLIDLAEVRRRRQEKTPAAPATDWRPGFVLLPWFFPIVVPAVIPVDKDGKDK